MTAAELADRLGGRKNMSGWIARCPAHDDRRPSLSISDGREGRLLLHCHAGCTFADVAEALGLSGNGFREATPPTTQPMLTAAYDYVDEKSNLLYQNCRYEPKSFKQRRPNGKGGWIWSLEGVRRVPYNLPLIIDAGAVLLAEGEKDVETLRELGYTASSFKGWQEDWAKFFERKIVYLLPDNDEPGRKLAERVAADLYDVAAGVHLVELRDLPDGGDITDLVEMVGAEEADAKLAELMQAAPNWHPRDAFNPPSFAELLARPEEHTAWLWDTLLPEGRIALLSAFMKSGKSTFLGGLLAALVDGTDYLNLATRKTSVLLLTEENSTDVLRRLKSLDMRPTENLFVHGRDAGPLELQGETIERLRAFIEENGIGLLVVDTLSRFWTVENENDACQVTSALNPILDLSASTGAAILLVVHDRKGLGIDGRQIRGSGALFANVDQALLLSRRQGGASTHRLLKVIGRYSESPEELLMDFKDERYVSLGDPLGADAKSAEDAVIKAIGDEAMTVDQISELTELNKRSARRAAEKLVERGFLCRTGNGKRGDPLTYQA